MNEDMVKVGIRPVWELEFTSPPPLKKKAARYLEVCLSHLLVVLPLLVLFMIKETSTERIVLNFSLQMALILEIAP